MAGKNVDSFSFIEPLGHDVPKTKIERYWASFWGPFALCRTRCKAYAKNSNMTFLPMKYSLERFELDKEMPDSTWIRDAFLALVRTEFSKSNYSLHKNWPRNVDNIITVNDDFLQNFSKASDDAIIIREATPMDNSPQEIARCIYDILCNIRVGDKKNKNNNNRDEFISRLSTEVENKSRLMFVIPGFPFKDQNRFRVPYSSDTPDLAEISFMLRLYRLTQSIYQVHPYGADVVVLTDGDLYRDLFDVDKHDVNLYMHRILSYRNKLNLQATVSFISLKEMIERSSDTDIAQGIIAHIEKTLCNMIENEDDEVNSAFHLLKQGMKWNYNSKISHMNVDDQSCWSLLCEPITNVEPDLETEWNEFDKKAENIAVRYAAVNLMLKKTNLIQKFFPDAIRGTVHPKQGQFALASNSSYAWNGVAWSDNWPKSIDDIKVRSFMDLANCSVLNQVVLENSNAPLFYTNSNMFKNLDNARRAFPVQQYKVSDMVLRPLTASDLAELTNLGVDDENFAWERAPQDMSYFKSLIEFRIRHYTEYGFGVYGIWKDEKLIGQAGLQVVEDEPDQVEWVMFIGKEYVGLGLGTVILRYILDSCRKNGMDSLYAIVRPDNEAGIGITKKFGGILVSRVTHYAKNGIKFRIDLTRTE